MNLFRPSLIARLAARLAYGQPDDQTEAVRRSMWAPAISGRPTVWMGLQHRGQPPARGILGGPAALVGTKGMSRRDKHRARVDFSAQVSATRPDFRAQIAREAKQARGRKARRKST